VPALFTLAPDELDTLYRAALAERNNQLFVINFGSLDYRNCLALYAKGLVQPVGVKTLTFRITPFGERNIDRLQPIQQKPLVED
jgi:hypothetical protein